MPPPEKGDAIPAALPAAKQGQDEWSEGQDESLEGRLRAEETWEVKTCLL